MSGSFEKIETELNDVAHQIGTQNIVIGVDVKLIRENTRMAFATHAAYAQDMLEWCASNSFLFNKIMLNSNDDSKLQSEKIRLANALDHSNRIMMKTRMEIDRNDANLRKIIRDIDRVLTQVTADANGENNIFKEMSTEWRETLESKINELNFDVFNFKNQIRSEISSIANLKMRIKNVQTVLAIDKDIGIPDEVRDSVRSLKAECIRYRKNHE